MPFPTRTDIGISLVSLIEKLFGLKANMTTAQQIQNVKFVDEYQLTENGDYPLRRIASDILANLTAYESNLNVVGDSEMSKFLDNLFKDLMSKDLKEITSCFLGTGGIILKPYTVKINSDTGNSKDYIVNELINEKNKEDTTDARKRTIDVVLSKLQNPKVKSKTYVDVLTQDKLIFTQKTGSQITKAIFEIDEQKINDVSYLLLEYHELTADKVYIVLLKAVRKDYRDKEVPLSIIPAWRKFPEWYVFDNVEQMLFTVIPSTRKRGLDINTVFGIPVDFGLEKIKNQILELLEKALPKEYRLKSPILGLDTMLVKRNENGQINLNNPQVAEMYFTKETADGDSPMELFAPPYQEQSIINGLLFLFGQYENGMLASAGIFTPMSTGNATATEIKRADKNTNSLVKTCRTNLEKGFNELSYACSIYAQYNEEIPVGKWEVVPNWDYSLSENFSETWTEWIQALQFGLVHRAEVREKLTNEGLEKAQLNLPDIEVGD